MTTDDLFSYLATVGLEKPSSNVRRTADIFASWEIGKLGDFCFEISERLPRPRTRTISPFSFVGNSSLGGDNSPCMNPSCRIRAVDSMARFATLYADKVFLPDPFEELHDWVGTKYRDRISLEIAMYVHVLYYLRPLLEEGIVSYTTTMHRNLCVTCYEKAIGEVGTQYVKKLLAAKRVLEKRYYEEIDYEVAAIDKYMEVIQRGPDDLVPHGQAVSRSTEIPKIFIGKEVPFKLTKRQVKAHGLVQHRLHKIISDLFRQNFYANMWGTNYLTQREIDLDISVRG